MSLISATQGVRDEIATRLNETESENTDQYTNWINLSLKDIQSTFKEASFLWASADRTLSAGTRIYTNLPTDFNNMNEVVFPAASIKMTYLGPDEFDTIAPSASAGGNPSIYTMRGVGAITPQIEFYYVPANSATIHYDYQRNINTVSASSAVIDLPPEYYELPIMYGEKMGLRRRGRYSDAQLVDKEYQELKNRMVQDLQRITTERVRIKSIREFQRANTGITDPIRAIFNE